MLRSHIIFLLALNLTQSVAAEDFSPFTPALLALNDTSADNGSDSTSPPPSPTLPDNTLDLRAFPLTPRQAGSDPCASSYTQCPGMPSLCCPSNSQCLPDAAGMVGCCPHGAACTGIVSQQTSAATSTAAGGGAAGGAAGGGVISSSASATTATDGTGGQVSILGGSLSATAGDGGATIFAAAGKRRADVAQEGTKVGAGLALGIAIGGLLIL